MGGGGVDGGDVVDVVHKTIDAAVGGDDGVDDDEAQGADLVFVGESGSGLAAVWNGIREPKVNKVVKLSKGVALTAVGRI